MSKTKLKKITKANITHISFVPKAANRQDFLIVKADAAAPNLQITSPILKTDDDKHLVTGVVYAPGVVDTQGEFMEAEAIEEAAHEFLAKHGNTDIQHNFVTNKDVEIVESSIAKADFELDGVPITKGTWTLTAKVKDNDLWAGIKKGDYNGFSMGGEGIREEVTVEEGELKKEQSIDDPIAEEAVGFFNAMINHITGIGKTIEKADKKKSLVVDFKAMAVSEKVRDYGWALNDAIRNILQSEEANKKELIGQQIDAYREFVLSEIEDVGIKKAAELFTEPIEKAGKSLSSTNAARIKAAHNELSQLLEAISENDKEEEEVKKEDIEKIIKEAMVPMAEKVAALEKGDSPAETNEPESITKEDISTIIKDALAPMEERITNIEKSRGVSRQLNGENQTIAKEDRPFSGVQI